LRPSRVQAPDPKEKYQNVSTLERAPAERALPSRRACRCAFYFLHDCAESLRRREQDCVDERQKRYVRHDEAKPVRLAR
jgi:hypothetical protein